MGVLDNTHAASVTLAVVLVSVAAGLLATAIIQPRSMISIYLMAQAVTLFIAVVVHGYTIYRYEKDRIDNHKELSKVHPEECPDYWTSEWDACAGTKVCHPYFETQNPAVPRIYMHQTNLANLNVATEASKGAINLCAANTSRPYPWLEVSNSCDARNRAV